MDMMVNSNRRPGKAIQASTIRWRTRSIFPPTKPEVPPTSTETTTPSAVADSPENSEILAPYINRLRKSRPMWSVPSRYVG